MFFLAKVTPCTATEEAHGRRLCHRQSVTVAPAADFHLSRPLTPPWSLDPSELEKLELERQGRGLRQQVARLGAAIAEEQDRTRLVAWLERLALDLCFQAQTLSREFRQHCAGDTALECFFLKGCMQCDLC